MKKLLVVVALLVLGGCKTRDCMAEFTSCLRSCDVDGQKWSEFNGQRVMTRDREATEKCQSECHLDCGR